MLGGTSMREEILHQTYDEERSLYNLKETDVLYCIFAGPHDGESVLKECRDINVKGCKFSLRYPLWHAHGFRLIDSNLDEKTRAPIWYSYNGSIVDCTINGIKCLRECKKIDISGSKISSPEFGWKCREVKINDSFIDSEYLLFESSDVKIDNLNMSGKYSFQYMDNVAITNSYLDTKDAFWHSKNVTVKDSVVKGEYLGWFSEDITFINCKISGTQPLCYCKRLKLINCTMEGADFSFEYSDVEADFVGNIVSVKNPLSGKIIADSIGEIIWEDSVMDCRGKVIIRNK